MTDDSTKGLPDKRSFEERVFARFDAIDGRFDSMEVRLDRLESRSYDTKPIWEQALAAIAETRHEVNEIKGTVTVIEGKVGVIEGKVGVIEDKVTVIESRVQNLEDDVRIIKMDQRTMRNEMIAGHRELKQRIDQSIDTVLRLMVDDRENVRDAQIRLKQLESKLA